MEYRDEYDSAGRWIARTFGDNPKRQDSWRNEYDDAGSFIARTFGDNPKHPEAGQ